MHRLSLLLLTSSLLFAQQALINGPVEGFVFDSPTRSFRAVVGLLGSASFGPAILDGFDAGSVAPHKTYGIASSQGACLLVSGLDSSVSSAALDGVPAPDSITWSGDGSVAVLYFRDANRLQRVSGLPDKVQVDAPVDLSPLQGKFSAIALDRQGANLALAIQGDVAGVFLLQNSQDLIPVMQAANPTALAFSESGVLYALDRANLQLNAFTLSDWSIQTLALDGLQDPSAVAAGRDSQNRQMIFVTSAADQLLRVYDAATQQVMADIPLDSKPTGIDPFGRSSFVIASRSKTSDPLWLFQSSPQAAVYFVPAARADVGGLE